MPGKKHQDIEAITILYKKIERIRDKVLFKSDIENNPKESNRTDSK